MASPFFPSPHVTCEFVGFLDRRAGDLLNAHLVPFGRFLHLKSRCLSAFSVPLWLCVFHSFVTPSLCLPKGHQARGEGTDGVGHQNKRSCKGFHIHYLFKNKLKARAVIIRDTLYYSIGLSSTCLTI